MSLINHRKEERKTKKLIFKCKTLLSNRKAEGYVDTAIKLIISITLGSLVLAGMYQLFNTIVLPGLAEKIQSMF